MDKLKIKELTNLVMNKIAKENLRLRATVAPNYMHQVKEKVFDHKEVIHRKVSDLNSWYTRIIGLEEVRMYQDRVVTLQEKLLDVQERRRAVGRDLTDIRRKSNELQDQIHKVKRQDDIQRFLDLMKEETDIIRQEHEIGTRFNALDREERDVFTAFTNAVRDSHEKQRAQLEYTKYFGLILSLVGSFLTFCYSTVKKQDLKRFIEDQIVQISGNSKPLLLQLQDNQEQMNRFITYIDKGNPKMMDLINKNHEETMKILQSSGFLSTIKKGYQSTNNVIQNRFESKENSQNNLLQDETKKENIPLPNKSDNSLQTASSGKSISSHDDHPINSSHLDKIVWYGCATLIGFIVIRMLGE